MSIALKTAGVSHLALRSTDLARSRRFYADTLGLPVVAEGPGFFVVLAGATVVGILAPDEGTPAGDRFSSSRVGLDHLALSCDDDTELARVAAGLAAAGVPNTGVKNDPATGKDYVAFDDTDGITWEFYRS
jgi:catechol 2,3-dioxygenase-like lactoylglutathione lyase family enzyme